MRVHFQQNFKILSRARSVHLWPCLGEEKERQRKIHMHAITLYSVISFNYTTIYIYIYIYIYTRLQKGCLQTDRYVEWVISIKYVKKRMQKYTALLYVMHISPWGYCVLGGGGAHIFLNILMRLVNKSWLRIIVPLPKHISTYFFLTRVRKQC